MRNSSLKISGGYIVAIEGIDAVGKNTHSLLLSKWLRKNGVETTRMSFPDYDTPIGREIKSFLSGSEAFIIHTYFRSTLSKTYRYINNRYFFIPGFCNCFGYIAHQE